MFIPEVGQKFQVGDRDYRCSRRSGYAGEVYIYADSGERFAIADVRPYEDGLGDLREIPPILIQFIPHQRCYYSGLIVECRFMAGDLYVADLPPMGDRPPYRGFCKPENVIIV